MADFAYTDLAVRFDETRKRFDLQLVEGVSSSFKTDHGLETAVIASLFTDRRARDDDAVPDGDRRGFWGDAWPVIPGLKVGSRLWLLDREIITSQTIARVREYGSEALRWLTDNGFARSVTFDAFRDRDAGRWVISVRVTISRPDGQLFERRFANIWNWMDQNK
ncbi:phage GP46 family protein [Thalassospira marina]|uniref:Phage tail protein n=1 Tax=Thalassospira marina TaxID=2048283 RepID=A0A2N3KJP3_9PROT|nr:phage GP46 family protein [Thalassospira marina]PKR50758.1 hypothetical protein COO20_20180 [Thalassospira marina]